MCSVHENRLFLKKNHNNLDVCEQGRRSHRLKKHGRFKVILISITRKEGTSKDESGVHVHGMATRVTGR